MSAKQVAATVHVFGDDMALRCKGSVNDTVREWRIRRMLHASRLQNEC
jgi:hypothetical protein